MEVSGRPEAQCPWGREGLQRERGAHPAGLLSAVSGKHALTLLSPISAHGHPFLSTTAALMILVMSHCALWWQGQQAFLAKGQTVSTVGFVGLWSLS